MYYRLWTAETIEFKCLIYNKATGLINQNNFEQMNIKQEVLNKKRYLPAPVFAKKPESSANKKALLSNLKANWICFINQLN